MKKIWWKLLFSLIVFTAILVTIIMLMNRQSLLQEIEQSEATNRQIIENAILHDMQIVDKAHLYFDTSITEEMQKELSFWRNYYVENPNYETWDIDDIKHRTGMEFYVIDQHAVTVATTYAPSVDFDFNECCERFVKLLDERRNSDDFYSDGLDNSAATKDLWKYGYWSTPDHQYILELGLQVGHTELFKSFNFFDTNERLVEEYVDLDDIKIINDEGFFLQPDDEHVSIETMDEKWQWAYREAITSLKPVDYDEVNGHVEETHRFVPYSAEIERGNSTTRIVYMKFNHATKLAALEKNTKQFVFTIIAAIIVSIILLFIELKILMSTIKLAAYDGLTDLYNRASYVQQMDSLVTNSKSYPIGLVLIDLDNFKSINDLYGHSEGDEVLKEIAGILKRYIKQKHFPVRFGGDEFALIVEHATTQQLENISQEIMAAVTALQHELHREHWHVLSVSIGVTMQHEPYEEESKLYKRADSALYLSKNNGKGRFTIL